ncbi:MAG: secretin N-terminal domain-containing protein, partial [Limisphaerales bacterium]
NNAVIINAPADLLPGISNVISKLDIPQEDTTQTKLFFLTNADSTALANELKMAFPASGGPAIQNANGAGSRGTAQFAGGTGPSLISNGGPPKEVPVNAVADPRTQSVLVTASKDTMAQIEQIVDRWDETPSVLAPASVNKFANDDRDVSLMLAGPVAQNGSASSTTIGSAGGGGAAGSVQRGAGGAGGAGVSGNNLYAAQGQVGPVTSTVDPIAGGFRYFTAPNNTTNAVGRAAGLDNTVVTVFDVGEDDTLIGGLSNLLYVDALPAGVVNRTNGLTGLSGSAPNGHLSFSTPADIDMLVAGPKSSGDATYSAKLHSAANQSGSGDVILTNSGAGFAVGGADTVGGGAETYYRFYDDNEAAKKVVAGPGGGADNSRLDGVSPYRGEVADSGRRQTNGIVGNTPGNTLQGVPSSQRINADVLDLVGPLTELFPQATGRSTSTASQQNALAQRMQTAAQQQSTSAQTTIGSSSSGGIPFRTVGAGTAYANSGTVTATNGELVGLAVAGSDFDSSALVPQGRRTSGPGGAVRPGAGGRGGGLGERLDYGIPLNQGGGRGGGGGFGGPGSAAAPAQQHYFSNSAPINVSGGAAFSAAPAAAPAPTVALPDPAVLARLQAQRAGKDGSEQFAGNYDYTVTFDDVQKPRGASVGATVSGDLIEVDKIRSYEDTSKSRQPGTPAAEEAKRLPGTPSVGAIDSPRFVTSDSVGVNFSTRNGPTNATVDYDSLYAQDVAKQAQYANDARNRERDTKTELEQVEGTWLLTDEALKSQAMTVLKSRVDSMGTAEPLLRSTGGENRLAAERALPAGADKAGAAKSFGQWVQENDGAVAFWPLSETNAPSAGKGRVEAYDIVGGFNGLYWTNSAQGAQGVRNGGALPSAATVNNWSEVAQVVTPMTNGFSSAGTINLELAREKKAPQLGDTPILGGLFKREVAAAPVAAPTTNYASGNNATLGFYFYTPETNRVSSLTNGALVGRVSSAAITSTSLQGVPEFAKTDGIQSSQSTNAQRAKAASFARGEAAPTRGSTGVSPYPLAPTGPFAAATNPGSKPVVMTQGNSAIHSFATPVAPASPPAIRNPQSAIRNSSPAAPAKPADITFHFSMPADQVLNEVYGPLVGRTLSRTNAPDAANLKNTLITLDTKSALTKSDAITDLEAVLGMNGITVVPVGTNSFRAVNWGNQTEGGLWSTAIRKSDAPPPKPAVPPPIPQPEVQTRDNAFSTFSLNVSDVSFKLAAASLQKGLLPEPATVRSEEFINA